MKTIVMRKFLKNFKQIKILMKKILVEKIIDYSEEDSDEKDSTEKKLNITENYLTTEEIII